MKNFMRKLAAPFALLFAVVAFSGCYNEENLWAARKGTLTLPIGGYIYYLNSAAGDARTKIPTGQEVLKSKIDGKSAETWIRDAGLESIKSFFYINEKFEEMGLSLEEDDITSMESYVDNMWASFGSSMEKAGVSKESFQLIYADFSLKQSAIFDALYGPNGEKAVSDKELTDYYEDTYYAYEYFTVSVPTIEDTTEESSAASAEKKVDEAAKSKIKEKLQQYSEKIKKGDLTVTEAADAYAKENNLESNGYNTYAGKKTDAYSEISKAVLALDENDAQVIESGTTALVLARKTPIAEKSQEMLKDKDSRINILSDMKWEEFTTWVKEQSANIEGIVFNDSAINAQKISSFFNADNKNGTSSAPDDSSQAPQSSQAG